MVSDELKKIKKVSVMNNDNEKMVEEITNVVNQRVLAQKGETSIPHNCGNPNCSSLAAMIDHTLLKQDASVSQIRKVCQEAREYQFASVCVNSCYVSLVEEMLRGGNTKVCTVIGFPLGACTTKAKVAETKEAIENGAAEVDMVINAGAIKSQNWVLVYDDIASVVIAAKGRALVKVIIETCLLTHEEKVMACTMAKNAKADFVKTSTGFSTGGAIVEDVQLMRQTVGPEMGVKASGGIRDYATAMAMINAGANRLGTSSGIAIVKGNGAVGGSQFSY
jgi:deoxyribose-phosphate aldolase